MLWERNLVFEYLGVLPFKQVLNFVSAFHSVDEGYEISWIVLTNYTERGVC